MKIGIVSDIHADAGALRRVLDDMPATDVLLCPGDAISEYRFCPDTVALLQRHDVQCIQGNHEIVLFGGRNPAYLEKCRATFSAESLAFLAEAPLSRTFDFDGASVLMVHASPWEPYEEYIYPGSPRLDDFAALPYDMVCYGHTHVPLVHRAGDVTVINPGSCSQPRDRDRRGAYAVFDTRTGQAAVHRVALDSRSYSISSSGSKTNSG